MKQCSLRIYCLQQWYNLPDPGVEEALYDSITMRRFAGGRTDADIIQTKRRT